MSFETLRHEGFLSLVTRRKNGQEVATPMWFVVEGDRIFMRTDASSGKVKRIRNNPRVSLAACTGRGRETGPRMEATARLAEPSLLEGVNRSLKQKYRFMKSLVDLVNRLRGVTDMALIELSAEGTSLP